MLPLHHQAIWNRGWSSILVTLSRIEELKLLDSINFNESVTIKWISSGPMTMQNFLHLAKIQGESFLGRKWLIGKKIKKELDKPEGISHAKMV